jgi:cytochrome c-type biogenesis protein CcmH
MADREGRGLLRRPAFGLVALLVVLAVALAVGSGLGAGGHQTDGQRASAIDAQIRCPSCEDVSVAQSSASDAIAVRHEVAKMVAQGASTSEIEDTLVGQYGPTILLRPPTSGLSALVWFLPAIGAVVAVAAVGALFWRRSRELEELRREEA